MLSRIARVLCGVGRDLERAQTVVRILEVDHKMHLERSSLDTANPWIPIAEVFEVEGIAEPDEAQLYGELVFSDIHPFSAMRCIRAARESGRTARDHISEEIWSHLNRYYLGTRSLDFAGVLRLGRSEFNQQVETFCDAFFGLAESTMIHGAPWQFLRIGRFLERACMIGRILEIRRRGLATPGSKEHLHPLDVHQWQTLLRSLSGYEPYRRAHDARIVPSRVLDFVLREESFPRSLLHGLGQVSTSVRSLASSSPSQVELLASIDRLTAEIARLDGRETLSSGDLKALIRYVRQACTGLWGELDKAFFSSVRPLPSPIQAAANASLVPQ